MEFFFKTVKLKRKKEKNWLHLVMDDNHSLNINFKKKKKKN